MQREALEFYSDDKHYIQETGCVGKMVGGGWAGADPIEPDWEADMGHKAERTLKAIDELIEGGSMTRLEQILVKLMCFIGLHSWMWNPKWNWNEQEIIRWRTCRNCGKDERL